MSLDWFMLVFLTAMLSIPPSAPQDVPTCGSSDAGKLVCDYSCRYMGVCLEKGDVWTWSPVRDCGDLFCDVNSSSCSKESHCTTQRPNVYCITAGNYPDVEDCGHWYKCDPINGSVHQACPVGKAYNGCTEKCDITASCSPGNGLCGTGGSEYVYDGNKAIHYTCFGTGRPWTYVMDRCEDGAYDEKMKACQPGKDTGCSSTGRGVAGGRVGGGTDPPMNVTCTEEGLIQIKDNCHQFYDCVDNGAAPELITCDPGFYFDPSKGGCVLGTC